MCGGWTEQAETLGTEAEGYVEGVVMPSLTRGGGICCWRLKLFAPTLSRPSHLSLLRGWEGPAEILCTF